MAHRLDPPESESARDSHTNASFALGHLDGCAVVLAAGELDLSSAAALREALVDAAVASDRIVLDLTRVTFLDASAMSAMMEALEQEADRPRATLCLVGPRGVARKALEVTGLTTLCPTYTTLQEAVAHVD